MFRTLLAAAAVYAYGHPSFDGHRPTAFDKPVQGFYDGINAAAKESRRALAVLNDARTMRYVEVVTEQLDAELRPLR